METRADLGNYSASLFKLQFFKATLLRFWRRARDSNSEWNLLGPNGSFQDCCLTIRLTLHVDRKTPLQV